MKTECAKKCAKNLSIFVNQSTLTPLIANV